MDPLEALALEVEVLELEVEVAYLAAGIPPGLRRPPTARELRAPINFAGILHRLDTTSANIGGELVKDRDELLALLAAWLLAGAVTPTDVIVKLDRLLLAGQLPPGVRDHVDRVLAMAKDRLGIVAAAALSDTMSEAASEGLDVDEVDTGDMDSTVEMHAGRLASAAWLAALQGLRGAAGRVAIATPGLTPEQLVHLLTQAALAASTAGLLLSAKQAVNAAQGVGRTAGIRKWTAPPGSGKVIVAAASELLDERTCEPCATIDGTVYESMDDALMDYPGGQYVLCHGGASCRGTLMVTGEGQDVPERAPLYPVG